MCQINTSAVSTVGDDYGGISTTDVVLPSSARGQFAQSSFVSVRVLVVTKKPNGSETVVWKNCVEHNIYLSNRPVSNYCMLKNDAGLNSECVVT